MKLNKDDWGFRVDVKTGKIELVVPKQEDIPFETLVLVFKGFLKGLEAIAGVMIHFSEDNKKSKK